MKKLLFFLLAALAFSSFRFHFGVDGNPVNKEDFSKNFNLVFEAAKKRFTAESGAKFSGATVTTGVDSDDLKSMTIVYPFSAASLDDAKAIKQEVADLIKTLVPADFKTYSTYKAGYAGYMIEVFEYNSDTFAEVSKRPVVRVGIILLEEGKYNLEIVVSEPVFKVAERPNQEKK